MNGDQGVRDAFLEGALDWIDRHLESFDPLWKRDRFDFDRGQRIGELAILARVLAGAGFAEDPRLGRMQSLLACCQASPVYRDRVLRSPTELMLFVETYATLRTLGLEDEGMRGRLVKAVRAGWLDQTERFPHRAMDIRSGLDSCGIDSPLPPLPELYRRSILGGAPDPALLGEHDLYALTHVVMFLSDFGARPPDNLRPEDRESAADLLAALVVVAAQDGHWDLLAEFLLCWSCLELPENGLVEAAWAALRGAQLPDGGVPGPEVHGEVLPFEHVYHTTLVCVVAAAVRRRKQGVTRPRLALRTADADERRLRSDATESARRAAGWLTAVAEEEIRKDEPSASRLAQILLGLWAASGFSREAPPGARLSRVTRRLTDVASPSEWRDVPPLLRCVAAAWLARAGFTVPALHGERGFLRRAGALFEAVGEGGGSHLGLCEMWSALHRLGVAPGLPMAPERELVAQAVRTLGSREAVDPWLVLVEAATASGIRRFPWAGDGAWLPFLAAGLCVDACRRYDLLRASTLLRTGQWMAPDDGPARRILRGCARYLMFNQREDGAFGLLGPELAARGDRLGTEGDDESLLLPVTVGCVWALAEGLTDWRLLEELGRLAPVVQLAMGRDPGATGGRPGGTTLRPRGPGMLPHAASDGAV